MTDKRKLPRIPRRRGEPLEYIQIRLPRSLKARFAEACAAEGSTQSEVVRRLMMRWVGPT